MAKITQDMLNRTEQSGPLSMTVAFADRNHLLVIFHDEDSGLDLANIRAVPGKGFQLTVWDPGQQQFIKKETLDDPRAQLIRAMEAVSQLLAASPRQNEEDTHGAADVPGQ